LNRSESGSPLRPQPLPPDLAEPLARAAERLGVFARLPFWYDEVGSTNDVAAALAAAGARTGTVVVAGSQRAGRGRQGRPWSSPPGAGLYISTVLRPGARVPPLLTLGAGLAVAEGVEAATGLRAALKWPNDLMAGARKLAGLLAESCVQPEGAAPALVLGVGLNLRRATHPPALAGVVTSLEEELGRDVDRGFVLAECLAALAARWADLVDGRDDAVLAAWRGRAVLGRQVEWDAGRGVAEDVDGTGALVVRTTRGRLRITSGEVRWSG
jgi:BirA family biotin operon repressor/biotin-[acetyl-CoA-carboxylase] ligase